jgi:hypothetical protein
MNLPSRISYGALIKSVAGICVVAILVGGGIAAHRAYDAHRELFDRVESDAIRNARMFERIEESLASLRHGQALPPKVIPVQDLDSRMRMLEEQLADLRLLPGRAEGDDVKRESDVEDGDMAEPLSAAQPPSPGLREEFERETGKSTWGAESEAGLEQGFFGEPFFARHGGSLKTDCRQRTCRAKWLLPDLGALSSEEREDMLMLSKYELLSLAAANSSDVGMLEVEWNLEDAQPSVAVVFSRSDAGAESGNQAYGE